MNCKKCLGVDPQLLSNREKRILVDVLRQTYALPELFAVLGLARSSYFCQRARLLVADKYAGVRRVMTDLFELNHRCYGYRRIRAALCKQQVFISEKVVRRLMRQEGLAVATTKRRRYGSYLGEVGWTQSSRRWSTATTGLWLLRHNPVQDFSRAPLGQVSVGVDT